MTDRLRALRELADATTPQARAAAIVGAVRACVMSGVVTVLIFEDDGQISATDPADARGFALRDGSAELRRLFLHALARFGDGGAALVSREQQRAFVGVTGTLGRADALFVPLLAGARSIGVVVVMLDEHPDASTREELVALCDIAARLLERDRALTMARRQSRDSQLLTMINERLHKSLDRRDVLFGIVDGVRAAFDADRCIVYERVANADRAAVAAAAVNGGAADAPPGPIDLDADLRKVFGGLTVRRDEIDASVPFGAGTKSAIAVPFVVDGHVEDALVLAFDRPHGFEEADVAALRSLAFHVGLALSNARLYERERARRSQAESLEHVVRILRDTQYVDEVLLVFAVTVSHELPVDCAAYVLEGNSLVRRAFRMRDQRSPEPEMTIERALLEPFLAVEEPSDESLVPREAGKALFDDRSGVIVPLRIDGTLWGMLVVRAADGDIDWQNEERATFFRTLGSHLEIALTNAHAYEREMRRAQERETLAEAARSILSHTSIAPLADVMCRLAANLVGAERACVLRWNASIYECVGSFGADVRSLIEASGFDLQHRAERLSSLATDDRRLQRLIDGPGYVAIPLSQSATLDRVADTIDAFLLIGREHRLRFGRDELRLLQEFAALLALALQNLELYEAMSLANRALQESSEFKDDLLAMLAHDFKGPLTVILGYCELLLEAGSEQREEIETIFSQTRRLVRLSDDALVLAQTQSEGFSLARTVVDLGGFVADCTGAAAPNNARVVVSTPSEPLPVELDPQRFRHVMDNLVQNALKYSDGAVHVCVRRAGDLALIEVRDEGIGIPADEVATLFTRFGRASNARRKGIAGSGIGLYVARKIVEVHKGAIIVQSKENEGSSFTV
ncbi:MAG: sensor histidine kinase, partial [Vulcanimicrobiaceae bacterium]